ncbi:lipase secretion chaperone [Moritella viscosa]|uniref:Lipase chaperone n=1 Tax=Moritella viscosa TaxID=80854 RepID=A0ABY1HF97_9GAMM|nr:lipase secretion chaperone [Moritella viscosa]SGY89979.1 Flagellar motor protein [Moritella viscosa]SGY98842.1 Flagellar motor protein [Moritella viscosa]SHO25934.1 Flagellar motor protein [Moritella viscosa]
MHNIKKSAAIISLFIISGTGIYLSGDNTNNTTTMPPYANTQKESIAAEIKTRFTSSIILPHKMIHNQKNDNISTTSTVSLAKINMPKSLSNTDSSSLLHIDNDNQLILNHDIKVLFDYFFSSEGDLTSPELLTSMQQYILQFYPQPAAQQALVLLNKYVDYKQQMQDFHAQNSALQNLPELDTLNYHVSNTDRSDTLQTVETLMQDRQNMRDKIFSIAEKDAMFGQEINYDQYMLTVAKLDTDLSPAERQQQIEQTAQQYLTDAQQEARKQTFILQNTPPNFRIDDRGECQGNNQDFTQQQVIALCNLARKRLARTESNS